jgi:geranylgeranyl diphosphate synthase, type I
MFNTIIMILGFAVVADTATTTTDAENEIRRKCQQHLKKADFYFENQSWNNALTYYLHARELVTPDAELNYKTGYCYLKISEIEKAFELLTFNCRKAGIPDKSIIDMVEHLSFACTEICEGQAIDVEVASSAKFPSVQHYIDMIGKKTATLFEVSCALGALSSPNHTTSDIRNLSSFGRNIGIAFQLVDDLIGVIGDPKLTGKAAGNDIREGKKTYPILLALKNANKEDAEKIKRVFGTRGKALNQDIKEAVRVISHIGIEQDVRNEARRYLHEAVKSIEGYSDSDARRALQFSANFVVGRSL